MQYAIRYMVTSHLPELARVERAAIGERSLDENELTDLINSNKNETLAYTAVDAAHDTPVGHVIYLHKKKHIEVLRLVVHPDHRRCLIGTSLLGRALAKVERGQKEYASFMLPDWTMPTAHRWLSGLGWRMAGRFGENDDRGTRFFFESAVSAVVAG